MLIIFTIYPVFLCCVRRNRWRGQEKKHGRRHDECVRARVPFLFLISREIIFPPKRGQIVSVVTPFSSLSLSLYTTNGLLPLFSRRIARVHSWMTHPTRSARSHTHTHTQTQTEFVFDFFFFFICILKNYTSIWVPGSFWCVTKSSISL